MSMHLIDLRPLKFLNPSEKANLPVSIAVLPDGKQLVVNRYADSVWDFYPYVPQENLKPSQKQINWRIRLPDGCFLTDPKYAQLLDASKDFIWSQFAQPAEGHKRLTMLSLRGKVKNLIPLLQWMVQIGLHQFSDLADHAYDYVPVARLSKNGGKVSVKLTADRLRIIEDLYHYREKLDDALPMHPWPNETTHSLAGIRCGGAHHKPKTKFIPDVVAERLATVALEYVQNHSARILDAMESTASAAKAKASTGCKSNWQAVAHTAAARAMGFKDTADLKKEYIRLRTACYIVIELFSGIRDSEMMSIVENCITQGKSRDGSIDVMWLNGTIYKTGNRSKKWLVPPIVKETIEVLTRLTAPLREELRQEEPIIKLQIGLASAREKARLVKRYDTVCKQKNKLFLTRTVKNRGPVSALSGHSMNQDLKKFCFDLGVVDKSGHPYLLHSHQFRRTYARFIARSELGDLLTLRDHFGHWSINMTVYYADGGADEYEAETELLEMISKEKMKRQNEIIGSYLDSDAPLANGGHWLKDWRSSVRTAPNKEALIVEYADTITLTGTGHSWCVGHVRGNGCGGLCVFEAQMCVDCSVGIIGQEHRPVWQGIRDQQKEALALDDMGPGGRARAQEILECAEKVLRRLDGQEEA